MHDQRNLLLAIVLSILIIFGSQVFLAPPEPQQPSGQPTEQTTPAPAGQAGTQPQTPDGADVSVPTVSGPTGDASVPVAGAPSAAADRAAILAEMPRIRIDSARLHGSIAITGARIDDLTLPDYRVTLDPESPEVTLLSPAGMPGAYFAEFGWVGEQAGLKLPNTKTPWSADSKVLRPGQPVTLSWDNGDGLRFVRTIELDGNYMFTVTQRVENTGSVPVALFNYGLISRTDTPPTLGFYILHEGPLGMFDGRLVDGDVDYDDLQDEKTVTRTAEDGWIGITDKYWLVTLAPHGNGQTNYRFLYDPTKDQRDRYQVDFRGPRQVVPAGGHIVVQNNFFAGAKELELLDGYQASLDIQNFDKAIDFGWFYFLTKPLFQLLFWINKFIDNYGVAILILTVLIKLVFFPLANKSYRAMSKMKALQPEMLKLRERFSEDKQKLNQEMMELYKRHKVNPTSGCLPILIQIPVFFALYKVLFVTIEMRQAPFFGWIQDLSAPDPTSIFNLFGLLPWNPGNISDLLLIGVWPLIMGGSMYLQQKLNPQPPDPVQAKIFMFLPLIFTVMLARFPAGLVIYWAWNNILTIAQQWVIMRRAGVHS